MRNVFYSSYRKNESWIIYFLSDLCQILLIPPNNMDTKRNQTLEEIEENKIVSEHYQNRIKLIKELLKTSQLVIGDLCVHINISEASYHRYTNFTSYMKTDIFIHACIFLKQYIESHHIPYTQEEKRLIKTLDLFQISSNSNLNCN
ncbi:hypothetical protein BACOV975_03276 [Bacteroides ovatus V975]|nr:hypothetical protein BACOV975_03276 [Bacteroides ovatus V975]